MKHYSNQVFPVHYTSVLYLCSFFLFLEWIYPLNDVTDTRNITVFIIYAAFCFLLSLFRIKWWISFPVKGIALIIVIHSLYYDISLFNLTWAGSFFSEMIWNIQMVFERELQSLTEMFRSLLFFILIWLMSYLLYYWFVQMKRIFIFIVMTFLYVTVLDTFTVYNAGLAIIRTFIISFIALGMINYMKEAEREKVPAAPFRKSPIWVISLIIFVLFSALIGFVAPKLDPQWPDPVPFIKSAAEGAGSIGTGGVQKVGYGEDDTKLGGSFIQDDTPVFRAFAREKQYWRIETKDVYTGKGWELSEEADFEPLEEKNVKVETFFTENVTTTLEEGIIDLQFTDIGKLMYPYGFQSVEELSDAALEYQFDRHSEAVKTQIFGEVEETVNYHFSFLSPTFPAQQLQNVDGGDEPEIVDRYTQLPDTLPERVKELAAEITMAYDNRYEKAKAIERYFSNNGFIYKTTDIPVPAEDEDYVDQFLFDSMVGYCDNFSTSMIVLLRSIDIPARWVKGFTSGEEADVATETGLKVYEVTNANAHSWVEVYFPDFGWVPFEPTQGFSNPTDFSNDSSVAPSTEEELLQAPEQGENNTEREEEQVEEEETEEVFQHSSEKENSNVSNELRWEIFLLSAVLLILIVSLLYYTRYRWKSKLIGVRLSNDYNPKTYQEAYHFVLKLLRKKGMEKEPDQTLREFAKTVDKKYETDGMQRLTKVYEQILYNNVAYERREREIAELWKNLINRILG